MPRRCWEMKDMADKILELNDLAVEFSSRGKKKVRALDGVNITLLRGETISVVGESGSGKSTLLRAAMALIPPFSGEVLLFGSNVSSIPPSGLKLLRRRCGYVPQDPYGAIPPALSAVDAVTEPYIIAGVKSSKEERRARAEAILSSLGLSGERILNSRAAGLSGGQRQRVEIARALMLAPELLLCDEPTSMQDASTRGEIIEVLSKSVKAGMSMLFVTHDLLLAAQVSQKIIVLKDGKVCERGSASEILSSPGHPYTRALIDALPKLNF